MNFFNRSSLKRRSLTNARLPHLIEKARSPDSNFGGNTALAAAIVGGIVALITTFLAAKYSFDSKMVEVGVQILSADPNKTDLASAREWAILLVEKHAGIKFDDAARESLLHHPIGNIASDFSSDFSSKFKRPPLSSIPRNFTNYIDPRDYMPAGREYDCENWDFDGQYWSMKIFSDLGHLAKDDPMAAELTVRCPGKKANSTTKAP